MAQQLNWTLRPLDSFGRGGLWPRVGCYERTHLGHEVVLVHGAHPQAQRFTGDRGLKCLAGDADQFEPVYGVEALRLGTESLFPAPSPWDVFWTPVMLGNGKRQALWGGGLLDGL